MQKVLFSVVMTLLFLCSVQYSAAATMAVTDIQTALTAHTQSQDLGSANKKSTLREKAAIRYIKKMANKSQQEMADIAAGRRGFSPFAFLMGFIFSWIGVLLVWIFGGNARSALIGAIVSLVLWILIFAAG